MRRFAGTALLIGLVVFAACGGDDGDDAAADPTVTVTETVAAETPAEVESVPATEDADPSGSETPEEAAQGLYLAWQGGDSEGASVFATGDAAAELFTSQASEFEFAGCNPSGQADGQLFCGYYREGTGLNLIVEGSDASGYVVTDIEFIAD